MTLCDATTDKKSPRDLDCQTHKSTVLDDMHQGKLRWHNLLSNSIYLTDSIKFLQQ